MKQDKCVIVFPCHNWNKQDWFEPWNSLVWLDSYHVRSAFSTHKYFTDQAKIFCVYKNEIFEWRSSNTRLLLVHGWHWYDDLVWKQIDVFCLQEIELEKSFDTEQVAIKGYGWK